MKPFWKKGIVGIIMIATFMAPISGGMKINKAKAQITTTTMAVEQDKITDISASFKITVKNTKEDYFEDGATFKLYDKTWDAVTQSKPSDIKIIKNGVLSITKNTASQVLSLSLDSLTNNTKYFLIVDLSEGSSSTNIITQTTSLVIKYNTSSLVEFTTAPDTNSSGTINTNKVTSGTPDIEITTNNLTGNTTTSSSSNYSLACGLGFWPVSGTLGGCIASILYTLWEASALIAQIAGKILDFFVYYSTNSLSYTNEFINQGWGAVRDIANILFIISLLYVAIKTILGLNVTDNKKLVGAVIVIALIINFSLFTTKVVIDASNILAKVFYNNITSEKVGSTGAVTGSEGEKSISIGLIKSYNPQNIVDKTTYNNEGGTGTFIFITILLLAITLYTAYIFFSVALLFVTRVVSLWISMIFSPLAFISYAVPFEIPRFGHKEWWSELLKTAFMAPIFIFFLYIIVLFTGFLNTVVKYTDNKDISTTANMMQHLMSTIIPFIIITILLKMAKDIAVKYSGELGAAVAKLGSTIGGAVVGGAVGLGVGAVATAGRATLGRAGAAMENSTWAKTHGGFGRMMGSAGKFVGAKSFDVRGIKVAGMSIPGTFGKAQEGGFTKRRAEQVEKRQKRAKELEVGEDETLKQNLNALENNLQTLLRGSSHEIEQIDKRIDAAIKANKAAQAAVNADPTNQIARGRAITTANRVNDLRQQKSDIKNANGDQENTAYLNTNLANRQAVLQLAQQGGNQADIVQAEGDLHSAQVAIQTAAAAARDNYRSINNYEDTIIPEAHHHIEAENRIRKTDYAESKQGAWSQTISFITSGGQHSFAGEREAGHKIIMEEKLDSGKKEGGH